MRYTKGSERHLPARCFFFLREDVMKIKDAFENYSVPVKADSRLGEFIALLHAMKNYLGRDSGLATRLSGPSSMAVSFRPDTPTGFAESPGSCFGLRICGCTALRQA
jgi:hypothetical protein